jgi:hypothetical protein
MVEMRKIADCSGQALRRLKEGWTAQPPADGGDPVDEVDKVGNWSHYALMADTITEGVREFAERHEGSPEFSHFFEKVRSCI